MGTYFGTAAEMAEHVFRINQHEVCPCDCDQLAGETCELCTNIYRDGRPVWDQLIATVARCNDEGMAAAGNWISARMGEARKAGGLTPTPEHK